MFVEVAGERRVKNVYIYNEYDEYVPINPNSYYLIASIDYILLQGGGGYSMFEDGFIVNYPKNSKDIEVLVNYLNYLNGDLSNYQELDDRITIK